MNLEVHYEYIFMILATTDHWTKVTAEDTREYRVSKLRSNFRDYTLAGFQNLNMVSAQRPPLTARSLVENIHRQQSTAPRPFAEVRWNRRVVQPSMAVNNGSPSRVRRAWPVSGEISIPGVLWESQSTA